MLNNLHKKIMSILSWTLLTVGVLALLKRVFHTIPGCRKVKGMEKGGEEESSIGTDRIVNINSSDVHELATIPYVSIPVAQNIVNYRELNGPFTKSEELLNVKGIGPKLLGLIEEYICVE